MPKLPPFNKYDFYLKAVQDPPAMCDFLENVYRDLARRTPVAFREDFSGAFALSYEWVTRARENRATAIDVDDKPLNFGKKNFIPLLTKEEQKRLKVLKTDVRSPRTPPADIIAALNFSYGVFKRRSVLKDYLKQCHTKLSEKGIVLLDCLGGIELSPQRETTVDFPDFTYTWEQESFNALSREAKFSIHIQRPGEKLRKRVFVYDWRMWTPIELRELMQETGFKRTFIYWEGIGQAEEVPDSSQSWVAYVVGQK